MVLLNDEQCTFDRENMFLHFINEQRKACWTEYTALGHITIPHSQSHRYPDHRRVSIWYIVVQVSVREKYIVRLVVTKGNSCYHYERDDIVVLVQSILSGHLQSILGCFLPTRSGRIRAVRSVPEIPVASCVLVS